MHSLAAPVRWTSQRESGFPLAAAAPGVLLCCAIGGFGIAAGSAEHAVTGRLWLEPLVLTILIGAGVRAVWTPGERWTCGVEVSAKLLLEVAVALLGASLDGGRLLAAGPALLAAVAAVVAVSLFGSYGLGRLFRLPRRMATLVACGNSICGNSAIAAVAPVIDADGDDVAAAIAFTAVLGVVAVLGLPLVGRIAGLDAVRAGVLGGLTVYAVPQVLAAAAPFGTAAVQMGALVKLVRVLALGPVCVALSVVMARRAPAGGARKLPPVGKLVPWFILAFLGLMAVRSAGFVAPSVVKLSGTASALLTLPAMAALGLGVDWKLIGRAGPRVAAVTTLSLALLTAAALGAIALLPRG